MDLHKALSSSSHGYGRHGRVPSSNHPNSAFSIPRCKFAKTKLDRPTLHYLKCSVPGKKKPRFMISSPDQGSCSNIQVRAHEDEAIPADTRSRGINKSRTAVFLGFMVPYALVGFTIMYVSRFVRVVVNNSPQQHGILLLQDLSLVVKLVSGFVCIICSNLFIVGINQIYDIEIDKINKPYKPLPSGDMSVRTAWALTVSYVVLGLGIIVANKAEPWVVFCYCYVFLTIGVGYSVPPVRFKRFPIFASFMFGMCHISGNFGIYRALKATLPAFTIRWTAPWSFITIFHAVIFFVLGLVKDAPDIEGDRKHRIFTPAAALGPRYTAFLGSGIVLLLYIGAIGASIVMPRSFKTVVMIPSHIMAALLLIYRVWVLDKTKYAPNECELFYRFLWNLVYLENFLFPFI